MRLALTIVKAQMSNYSKERCIKTEMEKHNFLHFVNYLYISNLNNVKPRFSDAVFVIYKKNFQHSFIPNGR